MQTVAAQFQTADACIGDSFTTANKKALTAIIWINSDLKRVPCFYSRGKTVIPKEVLDAIGKIVALGKECIVKKERGRWIVIENNRRVVYREP